MFRTPYRWTSWYGFRENLECIYYGLLYGVENLFHWLPVLWFDRDWDYSYLLRILRHKFLRMSIVQQNGCHVGCKRLAKQLRICAELCRRLDEEDYYVKAETATRRKVKPGLTW